MVLMYYFVLFARSTLDRSYKSLWLLLALTMLFCKRVELNYLFMMLYAMLLFLMVFYICICYHPSSSGHECATLLGHPYYDVKECL